MRGDEVERVRRRRRSCAYTGAELEVRAGGPRPLRGQRRIVNARPRRAPCPAAGPTLVMTPSPQPTSSTDSAGAGLRPQVVEPAEEPRHDPAHQRIVRAVLVEGVAGARRAGVRSVHRAGIFTDRRPMSELPFFAGAREFAALRARADAGDRGRPGGRARAAGRAGPRVRGRSCGVDRPPARRRRRVGHRRARPSRSSPTTSGPARGPVPAYSFIASASCVCAPARGRCSSTSTSTGCSTSRSPPRRSRREPGDRRGPARRPCSTPRALEGFAAAHDVELLEDAAQALGARRRAAVRAIGRVAVLVRPDKITSGPARRRLLCDADGSATGASGCGGAGGDAAGSVRASSGSTPGCPRGRPRPVASSSRPAGVHVAARRSRVTLAVAAARGVGEMVGRGRRARRRRVHSTWLSESRRRVARASVAAVVPGSSKSTSTACMASGLESARSTPAPCPRSRRAAATCSRCRSTRMFSLDGRGRAGRCGPLRD